LILDLSFESKQFVKSNVVVGVAVVVAVAVVIVAGVQK
jgi:hypothetical protein